MTKGEQSRQRLIDCAAELFWKNGYAATGISEILNASGLPKGSFYFYFKSKEELAVAVVSYYQAALLDKMRVFAANRTWLIAVYQGNLLLGRISQERGYLGCAKESMLQMYKEYRAVYGIASSEE